MLRLFAVLLIIVSFGCTLGEDSCQRTNLYLQSVLQQPSSSGLTYSTPTSSSSNKCRLDVTCCKATAESKLEALVETKYETKLYRKLNSTITQCLNSPIQSSAASFIDTTKAFTLSSVQSAVGDTLTIDQAIITDFYDYLKNGILTMNLDDLESKFKALYLKVFLATFREILEENFSLQLVTNEQFETCFYNFVFNIHFGTNMNTDYNRFKERFNLYFRYIWAVRVGDEVLSKVLNHTLSSDCKDSLLRMDHCSQCSASQDTPSNSLACRSMCLNTLRGCFVDLSVFGTAFEDYVDILDAAKDRLNVFDPFSSVNLLSNRLNGIVTTTSNSFDSFKLTADSICDAKYTSTSRKRRDVSSTNDHHVKRAKRQSTEAAKNAISDSVACLTKIPDVLKELSSTVCDESSSVSSFDYNCWNGSDVNSYWWTVVDSDRLSQANNPELKVEADTGLLYKDAIGQLNLASSNLENCRANVRTCTEKLSSFTSPDGSQYDFGSSAEFQSFTQLGFPAPQIVSSIPVSPASASINADSSSHQISATPLQSLSTTTSSANIHHSTLIPSSSSSPMPRPSSPMPRPSSPTLLSSSVPPRVRPSYTRQESLSITLSSSSSPSPLVTDIPDTDKPKLQEQNSGSHLISCSFTIIHLLSTIVIILSVLLL